MNYWRNNILISWLLLSIFMFGYAFCSLTILHTHLPAQAVNSACGIGTLIANINISSREYSVLIWGSLVLLIISIITSVPRHYLAQIQAQARLPAWFFNLYNISRHQDNYILQAFRQGILQSRAD